MTFFDKTNIRFAMSVKNYVDWCITRAISVQKSFKDFLPGVPPRSFFRKIFFRQKYTNDMSSDSVFDVDHESVIIFMKICAWRMKSVKYEPVLEYRLKYYIGDTGDTPGIQRIRSGYGGYVPDTADTSRIRSIRRGYRGYGIRRFPLVFDTFL